MLNLTNTEINTLLDALTEQDHRADVAAMFTNDLVLTDVSESAAYTAPVPTADDILSAMKLSCM
jgi:hypothetical protein